MTREACFRKHLSSCGVSFVSPIIIAGEKAKWTAKDGEVRQPLEKKANVRSALDYDWFVCT